MASSRPIFHPTATGKAAATVESHHQPKDLLLWAGWFCPFTQRVWVLLEELGIEYQYKEVNPYKKEPEFLALSPHGLVPALQTKVDRNWKSLHDSIIICEYLIDEDPSHRFLPPRSYERAVARSWIDHINKMVVPAFFRLLQAQPADQAQLETALKAFKNSLREISEKRSGRYFFGDKVSLVDIAIAPWAVRDFIPREFRGYRREEVGGGWNEWAQILQNLPSVVKTTSDPERYVEFNQTFLKDEAHSQPGRSAKGGTVIL